MHKNIKFSVSLSVYKNDNPVHFRTALESIIYQTLISSEIILVIDGPVPKKINNVIKLIKKKFKNLIVIKLQKIWVMICKKSWFRKL